jgi:hypothetical protein
VKRREVLRILPISLAGARIFSVDGPRSSDTAGVLSSPFDAGVPGPAGAIGLASARQPLAAGVRPHNGVPTLFLNGRPTFAAMSWVAAPEPDRWEFADQARWNAEAGIHIYAFDVGKGREWVGPGTDPAHPYDFSSVAARFGRVLEADSQALFHLRIYLETGHDDWWETAHPAECEVTSEGKRNGQSFASTVWRREAKEFLAAYIDAIERAGLLDRLLAGQVGAGHTGEWVKGETSMYWPCGDYSEPMRRHFRSWLRRKYGGSATALQSAWANGQASFETAEVPTAEAQLSARRYTFRDPRLERNVIDYYECLAELCADCLIDFCAAVKRATAGRKLAGAFYGYLLDLAWNGGFFKERPDSDYSTYQRSGHLGLARVLRSPDVDFLASPYSYGFRGIGGDGPSMLPAASARLHGKLVLVEDDTRTHADATDTNYGQARNLAESVAILRRNFAGAAARGQGLWWAAWKVDAVKEPAFRPLLRSFQRIGTFALSLDRRPSAQIAAVLDDESIYYESDRNTMDLPLIFEQRLRGLARLGAPFDTYLLGDLLEKDCPPHKLYVFLNPFRLDAGRRAALKKLLRRGHRVALWIYAPGLIQEDLSVENMRDLTGIGFGLGEQPWGPFVHLTNLDHPITHGLSQDVFWGTDAKLAPLFYVADRAALELGQVVYSQGNCKTGFAVRAFPEWTSVYSAAPNLPASVLRGLARFAGVHIYSEDGDVLYASRELLGVHTAAGGRRLFRLPAEVEVVHDLFDDRRVAEQAADFEVTLAPASTSLFYVGSAQKLEGFKA